MYDAGLDETKNERIEQRQLRRIIENRNLLH